MKRGGERIPMAVLDRVRDASRRQVTTRGGSSVLSVTVPNWVKGQLGPMLCWYLDAKDSGGERPVATIPRDDLAEMSKRPYGVAFGGNHDY